VLTSIPNGGQSASDRDSTVNRETTLSGDGRENSKQSGDPGVVGDKAD
jgi:hypothetical protein